jgi:formylglycine-generating enzyme required for sulfatase activity
MRNSESWVLEVRWEGQERRFTAADLPVYIGDAPSCDLRLPGVSGSFQLGALDGTFFVQPGRETRGLRVDGEAVTGSRRLQGGENVALDTARLSCELSDDRLTLIIEGQVTGGDTAPPDLEELAREAGEAGAVEIAPIAFRPRAEGYTGAAVNRPSKATMAVGAAFVVLAVLGWFAFTAKSVELVIQPAPQEVGLPETLLKLRMGERLLLRSGSHRVAATLDGYYPLDEVIEVGPAPDQTIELELMRLPGLVTLTTEPAVGAQVHLDGELLGATPLTDAEITPGRHRLEFTAARYLSEVQEIEVVGGGERQILAVVLTPNWAPITLTSDPVGAQVLVDGAAAGVTPVTLELGAGERQLELRLRGYNAWRYTVSVLADRPQTLPTATLTQADGRIELVTDPEGAAVSVNGAFRGQTPLTLRLSPGRAHQITMTKPGYETLTRELSVEADSGRRLDIPLTAQFGVVEIRSDPPGAGVWIDGQRRGVTPTELRLTAVSHRLEVRRDGFAVQSREITPKPGFPQLWEPALEQLDSTTGSGYARTIRTSLGQELRLILPGSFTMGSSRREQGRRSNEVLRAVQITEAFYLGVREVSNAEFRAFEAEHDSGTFSGISLNDDEQPVVRVTWEGAAQFLNWLSIRDGLQPVYEDQDGTWAPVRPLRNGYRLPTEAEWAWAARFAGQEEPLTFPWGAELPPPDRSGNFADIAAAELLPTTLVTYSDGFAASAPSGSFDANAVGMFDLGGNVAEWVQDYYAIGGSATEEVALDPLGPEDGRFHIIRGSSWRSATVTDLRLASRNYSADSREDVGFRIARNLE